MNGPTLALTLLSLLTLSLALAPAGETASTSSRDQAAAVAQVFEQQIRPFLTTYCVSCHGAEKAKGDLDLARLTTASVGDVLARKDIWKDCAGRMHAREMPPAKERKQPSDSERSQFAAWVRSLKQLSPKDPGPGVIRRLSQVEYANTLRDLLGVDRKVADSLPPDMVGEGFSSSISPLLMEKYLVVADEVLDQLIRPDQLTITWKAGQLDGTINGKREDGKADGGERRLTGPGEIFTTLSAPAEGTYTIRVRASAEKATGSEPARLAVRIDTQVVGEVRVLAIAPAAAGTYVITCKLGAGRCRLSVLMANPFIELPPSARKPAPAPAAPPPPKPAPAKPGASPCRRPRTTAPGAAHGDRGQHRDRRPTQRDAHGRAEEAVRRHSQQGSQQARDGPTHRRGLRPSRLSPATRAR